MFDSLIFYEFQTFQVTCYVKWTVERVEIFYTGNTMNICQTTRKKRNVEPEFVT